MAGSKKKSKKSKKRRTRSDEKKKARKAAAREGRGQEEGRAAKKKAAKKEGRGQEEGPADGKKTALAKKADAKKNADAPKVGPVGRRRGGSRPRPGCRRRSTRRVALRVPGPPRAGRTPPSPQVRSCEATRAALAGPIEAVVAVAAAAQDAVRTVLPLRCQARPRRGNPRRPAGSVTAGEPTRAELYKSAQRLDIPGRSKMTRDELAAAVQAAGG